MAQLPQFQSDDLPFQLLQSKWASQLNPVISNRLNSGTILKNIILVAGTNVINHTLGTSPIGWFLIDSDAAITLYRSAPFNNLTLTLVSSGPATVSMAVI